MGKNNRLSRDQKRRLKLKKREGRSSKPEALAYHGQKYKTEEYAPIHFQTEIGIYEAHVVLERTLTDKEVELALAQLIGLLREGIPPRDQQPDELTVTKDYRDALVMQLIRARWYPIEEEGRLPGLDDLIGILRTILSSIEYWRSQTLHSQSYLRFLEGLMKNAGVSVRLK